MLKQQDMTETARVVFNELSVTEPAEGFLLCGNGRLVGVSGTCQPSAHESGSQANLRPIRFAQKRYEPIREVLIDLWLIL
ncbi:hypothetical protein QUQ21_001665 [Escherichia coli]|nr:hypothetical protein [Escherichia coli]